MTTALDRGLNFLDQANRRTLLQAGMTEEAMESSVGPQTLFTGGSGRPLWLLHGAGDHAGSWARVVPKLLASGLYRVLIPDLAGHGASAPAEGLLSMEMFLAGFEAVFARTGDAPAIVAGNSFGAWLAVVFATRNAASVERIVAIDGGPVTGIRPDLSLTPKDRTEARRLWEATVDQARWAVPDMVLDEVIRRGREGALARMSIPGMQDYLMDGHLDSVLTPVDLIWGESDRIVPLEYARKLADALPRARLTTIPACGHVPQLERPEQFVTALLETLASDPPEGHKG